MDDTRFDSLTRLFAGRLSRRAALASALGLLAAAGARHDVGAQVSQAQCGNQFCASNPGGCNPGCVCCVYTNAVTGQVTNSRCRPPGTCSPGAVACPAGQTHCPELGRCAACCAATTCPQPSDPCQAATCVAGVCGIVAVGTGEPGACANGQVCCGGGCTPLGTNANCGFCGDVCDGVNETCGGGNTPGVCGCTDDGSACGNAVCGTATTNCGVTVACGPLDGSCPPGLACNAGQCLCTAASCPNGCCDGSGQCFPSSNATCGLNGAACDACEGFETCGGGGQAGVCGCADTTTACTAAQCGQTITDLCGQPIVCPPCEVSFGFSGGTQNWTVPAGATVATFDLYGGQGGNSLAFGQAGAGGLGGRAAAALTVASGSTYQIVVGGRGNGAAGGFNGGGAGRTNDAGTLIYGGGGGATDVRSSPFGLADRLLVAGGGGGAPQPNGGTPGTGGGETGGDGVFPATTLTGGGGGTQAAGGAGGQGNASGSRPGSNGEAGTLGQGGAGGSAGTPSSGGGAGGGGGLWGGGGGGGANAGNISAPGGGGSGFITPGALSVVAFANGVRTGDGLVTIAYRFD